MDIARTNKPRGVYRIKVHLKRIFSYAYYLLFGTNQACNFVVLLFLSLSNDFKNPISENVPFVIFYKPIDI